MAIGVAIGLFFVIRANYHTTIATTKTNNHYLITLNKDVFFLNKALLRKFILLVEENSTVTIDAQRAQFIDHDILEAIDDFIASSPDRNITA